MTVHGNYIITQNIYFFIVTCFLINIHIVRIIERFRFAARYMVNDPDQFWHALQFLDQERIPQDALMVSMNELSNHDHARFLTRTNLLAGRLGATGPDGEEIASADAECGVRRAVFREAVVLQMTLPGAPTVYYGDEAGLCGFTDPDNRRTYPWGREDREMITLHKELIRSRAQQRR